MKTFKKCTFLDPVGLLLFCRNVLPYYISKGHITPDLGNFIFRSEKYELFSQNFVNILCFFGSILDLTLVCKENFRPVRLLSVYDDGYCTNIFHFIFNWENYALIRISILEDWTRLASLVYCSCPSFCRTNQTFSRCSKNISYIQAKKRKNCNGRLNLAELSKFSGSV